MGAALLLLLSGVGCVRDVRVCACMWAMHACMRACWRAEVRSTSQKRRPKKSGGDSAERGEVGEAEGGQIYQ